MKKNRLSFWLLLPCFVGMMLHLFFTVILTIAVYLLALDYLPENQLAAHVCPEVVYCPTNATGQPPAKRRLHRGYSIVCPAAATL